MWDRRDEKKRKTEGDAPHSLAHTADQQERVLLGLYCRHPVGSSRFWGAFESRSSDTKEETLETSDSDLLLNLTAIRYFSESTDNVSMYSASVLLLHLSMGKREWSVLIPTFWNWNSLT